MSAVYEGWAIRVHEAFVAEIHRAITTLSLAYRLGRGRLWRPFIHTPSVGLQVVTERSTWWPSPRSTLMLAW